MMDADAMYPGGFHAANQNMTPDYSGLAKHFSRTERPPRYYFIDFGISIRFSPDDSDPRTRVDAWGGGYDHPPENRKENSEYNPFPADVYYMGNIIKHNFTEVRNKGNDRSIKHNIFNLGQRVPRDQEKIRSRLSESPCR